VIAFIKHLTLPKDVFDEEVTHRQPFPDGFRASHDEVERKTSTDCLSDARRLQGSRPIVRHDNQKVHVGIFGGLAIRIGTEKHDPFRMELVYHFLDKFLYVPCGNHYSIPNSKGMIIIFRLAVNGFGALGKMQYRISKTGL
jgi:hypothetical protein